MGLRPIQAGGMFYVWRSPDSSARHSFLKLYLKAAQRRLIPRSTSEQ